MIIIPNNNIRETLCVERAIDLHIRKMFSVIEFVLCIRNNIVFF